MGARQYVWAWVFAAGLALAAGGVRAGQDCGERAAPTPQALSRGLQLGERVRDQLESSGASMALVARVGLNLSEFNQRYTHMGVALRDQVRNRWQVVHLFNPCGKPQSEILTQPLERFYEVDLYEYDALLVVPGQASPVAQRVFKPGQIQGLALTGLQHDCASV